MLRNITQFLIFTFVTLTCFAGNPTSTPTPPARIKEDTIVSVRPNSIRISHISTKKSPKKNGSNDNTEIEVTKTYEINVWTEISVNGKRAKVDDLKAGMSVTVAADPVGGLRSGDLDTQTDNSNDGTMGGLARFITAHDSPVTGPGKKS